MSTEKGIKGKYFIFPSIYKVLIIKVMIINTRKIKRKKSRKKGLAQNRKETRAHNNNVKSFQYANKLRSEPTKQELMLIAELDKIGVIYAFQRPFSAYDGCYIADFYFPMAVKGKSKYTNLVVEIDGSQHSIPSHKKYDRRRSFWLKFSKDCLVVRFTNRQIEEQMPYVIQSLRYYNLAFKKPKERKLVPITEYNKRIVEFIEP